MATPIFACGAECHVAPAGAAVALNHWTSLTGAAPTFDTTIFEPSGGVTAFKFTGVANTATFISHVVATTTLSARFFLYVSANPVTAACAVVNLNNANGAVNLRITTAGALTIQVTGSAGAVTVQTLSLSTWYLIDLKADASGATATSTVTVNGINSTTDSHAQTSANFTSFRIGTNIGGVTATGPTVYFDQILLGALADYPLGGGSITGYLVGTTSGTHSQTAGDFQNDAGTNITNGDGSGAKLTEVTPDTTSFIKHPAIVTAGGYVEYIYATSAATVIPRAVEQIVAVSNVSLTTANDEKSQLFDGTTAADAYGLTTVGSTGLVPRSKQWASPPTGGAWTLAQLQAARLRWGFSTDVNPVPYVSWTMLEVEIPASVTASAGVATATGAASGPSDSLAPTGGVATATGAAYTAAGMVTPTAGVAAATGSANTAAGMVAAAAGVAAGVGAANSAAAQVAPTAGVAAATGAAAGAAAQVSANAGIAQGLAAAYDATGAVAALVGVATGTGTAYNPTVTTVDIGLPTTTPSHHGGPPLGSARITGRAQQYARPAPRVIAYAGTARAFGRAYDAKTTWNDDDTAIALLLGMN